MAFVMALANLFIDGVYRKQGEKFEYNGKGMSSLKKVDHFSEASVVLEEEQKSFDDDFAHPVDNISAGVDDAVKAKYDIEKEEQDIIDSCMKKRSVRSKKS